MDEIEYPRGVFYAPAVGVIPIDISTQATFSAEQPVYVLGLSVNFDPGLTGGETITFRSSDGNTDYLVIRAHGLQGFIHSQFENLHNFRFYAAGGLEVVASGADVASVTILFFDTSF